MSRTLALAPLILLAACGAPAPSDYAEAFPDDRLLLAVGATSAARSAGEPSDYEAATRDVAGDVNGFVKAVTDTVKAVTSFDPTWKDGAADTALWGPWSDDGVDGQLWVERDSADATYTWAFEVRKTGDADWLPLAAGTFTPDGTGRGNGTGAFTFDWDVWYAIDPSQPAGGSAVLSYTLTEDLATVDVLFDSLDGTDVSDLDASYHYTQATDGSEGAMDLAFLADAAGDPAVLETILLRSRWTGPGAGRGDAWVTGGDLGELTYTATECWDDAGMLTFVEDNATLERSGDAAACAFAQAEYSDQAP